MRKLLAVVALSLAACGPGVTNLSGRYVGTVLESATCQDGSGGTQGVALDWTIQDDGATATILYGGGCSPITARGTGGVRDFDGKDCGNGLHLQAGSISEGASWLEVASELLLAPCTSTFNGRLTRQ